MNEALLEGHVASDPKTGATKSGLAFARFNLACNRGQKKDGTDAGTDFIPIVVWDRYAELTANKISKGSKVFVRGKIMVRSYTSNGQRKYVTEVVASFLSVDDAPKKQYNSAHPAGSGFEGMGSEETDEEIPF